MKKLFTCTLLALSFIHTYAQHVRCRAMTFFQYNSVVPPSVDRNDSTKYYYSNGRPGKHVTYYNYYVMKYDSAYTYTDVDTDGTWTLDRITYQTFDSKDNIIRTLTVKANSPDSISRIEYTYTPLGDTAGFITYNYNHRKEWVPEEKVERTYDALRRLQSIAYYDWEYVKKVWTGFNKYIFSYTATGNLEQTLTHSWRQPGQWEVDGRELYTYTNNQLTEKTIQYGDGTTWTDISRQLYYYVNGLLDSVQHKYHNLGVGWEDNLKYKYTYNSVGLCDTEWIFQYDMEKAIQRILYDYTDTKKMARLIQQTPDGFAWKNQSKNELTYDVLDNEISHMGSSWENGAWVLTTHDFIFRMYYDPYNPDEASVADTKANNPKVNVYPIPSVNMINVLAEWETPQPFTVSITTLDGRLVKQWDEKPTTTYRQTIPVNTLPAGNYIITLQSAEGTSSKQFIVK